MIVEADSPLYRNITILRGTLSDGSVLTVAGTLAGTRMVPKIVGINGYEIEVPIAEHHIVMLYRDRPGIVALYGTAFGEAGINIAGMAIAREEEGGQALSILTVDSPVPDELLERLRVAIDAEVMREVDVAEV